MSLYIDIEKKLDTFTLKAKFSFENGNLGFLGASGSGKTMVLKCIAGIEKPDKGKIVLDDKVLFDSENNINLPIQERNVGFVFQNYALFTHMTVKQNIGIGIKSKVDKELIINEYIQKLNLCGLENKYPNQLSGGQAQRVAIARSLVTSPDILLLDEPFSALDSHLKYNIENELMDILKGHNVNVIFVTHDAEELYRICEKTVVYEKGIASNIRYTKDLFDNPQTLSQAMLTGFKNISSIERMGDKSILAKEFGYRYILQDKYPKGNYICVRNKDIKIKNVFKSRENIYIIENIIEKIYTFTLYLSSKENREQSIKVEVDKKDINIDIKGEVQITIDEKDMRYF